MPSPSCPSSVIDQSHPHDNQLLGNAAEPGSEEEDEEEEEDQGEEEYAVQLYLPVTLGNGTFIASLTPFLQEIYFLFLT